MEYQPKYTITDDILTKIAEIETLRTKVEVGHILPEREIELRYRATVEATHSSTSIEGNPLNYRQVEKALSTKDSLTRHQYAELEVRNYQKALNFVDKRKKGEKIIKLSDILEMHHILMNGLLNEEKVGALRRNSAYIENQNNEVLYNGPEPEIIKNEIENLLKWLSGNDLHPVITSALLHLQFVSIHPFSDGNGRTARLLTSLYLGLHSYDFRGSLVLDSYYSIAKQDYYNSLHRVQGSNYSTAVKADTTSWIEHFTQGFLSSVKVLSTEIALLSSTLSSLAQVKTMSSDDADILIYTKQFGAISLSDAEAILPHVSRRTLQRKLQNLVNVGYLTVEGKARSTIYKWALIKKDLLE